MEFTTLFILFFLIFVLYAIYHLLSSDDKMTITESFQSNVGGQKSYTDDEVQGLIKQWGDSASQTGLDSETVKQRYDIALSSDTNGTDYITMKRIEKRNLEQGTNDFLQNIYELADRQVGITQDNQILSNMGTMMKDSPVTKSADPENKMGEADKIKKETGEKLDAERNKQNSDSS